MPIAEAAKANGFNLVIGYGELGGAEPFFLEQKGFKIIHIPMKRGGINPLEDLRSFIYIWKFFKKERPDIIHLVTIKPYLYGGIVAYLLRVPSLVSAVSGLGTIFINKDIKYRFLRLLLYPFYKLAFKHRNQTVIFQNNDDLKVLTDWNILKPTKAKLIKGSGISLQNFTKLDEPRGTPIVCFAARLLQDKGVNEFISAARILKGRGIKARFYLAGDSDFNNPTGLKLKNIKKLKDEDCVEVLGYHKDIPELYASSHIVCLPSYREGLPKSLIEAAAASRAVVTTDTPGCRDAIIPNKTGLIVPVKDKRKLADALQWLIEHPKERICMGKAGRKLAEKEFLIEKVVENHLDIYQKLINNKI